MGATLDLLKTLLIPASIALALYLLFSYAILPFVRQHRHRYNQYLPLNTITSQTASFRHRLSDAIFTLLLPPAWARARGARVTDGSHAIGGDEDSSFDDEDGEDMVGFDIDSRRREALERRRSEMNDSERRLSRDLEEGFRDDSDDERTEEPRHINTR
ncbi:MAG: hypothetical protein M1817_004570 [Caeruleum heppii]|nr:MAG: hypothetical protein M1817_004570 [Caeruleum heppii]